MSRPRLRAAVAWSLGVLTVVYGGLILPYGLPVVPPGPLARYMARFTAAGVTAGVRTNGAKCYRSLRITPICWVGARRPKR